jgi:hypothetical protein
MGRGNLLRLRNGIRKKLVSFSVLLVSEGRGAYRWFLFGRYLDTIGFRLCHPQELCVYSSTVDGGCDAKGCEDAAWMGLGYWEEKAQEYMKVM